MSFYSKMIKPLISGVIKNLKSPEADEKLVKFLIEGVTDEKLWQLKIGYGDILFRIRLYGMAREAGASGTVYSRFVAGGSYYTGVLAAIAKRYANENNFDINGGYALHSADLAASAQRFLSAAKRFSGEAAFCYGVTLLAGGDKDDEAAFWFRFSAECGYGKGMVNLALCYKHGAGVQPCVPLALVWLARAVLRGEETAKSELAEIYKYGDGTDTDFEKSYALSRGADDEARRIAEEIINEYY